MSHENIGSALLDEMKQKHLTRYNSKDICDLKNELEFLEDKIESIKTFASSIDDITVELSVNFAMLKAYKDRLLRISIAYHFDRFCKIQDSFFKKEKLTLPLTKMFNS